MMYAAGQLIAQRYRVERELGAGGFGEVFEATDVTTGKHVAIKVTRPDDGQDYLPATKARFQREARAVEQLESPHTVRLLDAGDSGGKLFMAFEMVPGEDLRQLLERERRLQPAMAVHVLRQLLDSLGEAHRAGILHRDIKPENIRVFATDNNPMFVKLLDFGLARPTEQGAPGGITKTGELLGTPRYMSPEQLKAEPLTPASDIYSLGIVLLEMLLGSAAIQGGGLADQFDRMRTGHVFSSPELRRIGPELARVIERMTAVDPDQRFQSADAVLATWTTTAKPTSRNRASILVAATAAAVVLLVAALLLVWPRPSENVPPQTRTAVLVEQPPVAQPAAQPRPRDAGQSAPLEPLKFPDARPGVGSAGCTKNVAPDDELIYVPPGYEPGTPHPVIVFMPRDLSETALVVARLHAEQGEKPLERHRLAMLDATRLLDYADEHDLLVLIPRAEQGWNPDPNRGPILRSIEKTQQSLCVDTSRLFLVADFESGAVALDFGASDWVAAIAVYAFMPERWRVERLVQSGKPTLWLTPTNSRRVPMNGDSCLGEEHPTLSEWEATLRGFNGCDDTAVDIDVAPGASCRRWSCEAPLWSCAIAGGYHWPNTKNPVHRKTQCAEETIPVHDIEHTILRFFAKLD